MTVSNGGRKTPAAFSGEVSSVGLQLVYEKREIWQLLHHFMERDAKFCFFFLFNC